MAECNVSDARDQINNGLAQIQSAMKEMQTELEAAMCAYHVADDKERGRMHLTVGYRKVKAKVEQGMYNARRNGDKIVQKAQRLEREKVREEEEEQLLEALEDAESPRKKMKVEHSEKEGGTWMVTEEGELGSSGSTSEKKADTE